MVKHIQTIPRLLPTNCLSVFDHFVGLGLKEFMYADGISELRLHRAKLKILLKIAAITTNCLGAVYMRAGTG